MNPRKGNSQLLTFGSHPKEANKVAPAASNFTRREFLQQGLVTGAAVSAITHFPLAADALIPFANMNLNPNAGSIVAPTWDKVVLLLNFNGANGSSEIFDEANYSGTAPTEVGTPAIATGAGSNPYGTTAEGSVSIPSGSRLNYTNG
jgi:hypothetical protein